MQLLAPPVGADKRFFGLLTDPLQPLPATFFASPVLDDSSKGMIFMRNTGTVKPASSAHVLLVSDSK